MVGSPLLGVPLLTTLDATSACLSPSPIHVPPRLGGSKADVGGVELTWTHLPCMPCYRLSYSFVVYRGGRFHWLLEVSLNTSEHIVYFRAWVVIYIIYNIYIPQLPRNLGRALDFNDPFIFKIDMSCRTRVWQVSREFHPAQLFSSRVKSVGCTVTSPTRVNKVVQSCSCNVTYYSSCRVL